MRRKLVSVLLVCAMSLSLAACGSASSSTGNDASDSDDTESTEAAASSNVSDDSKDEKSSKVPTKVTADNLTDFPVTDSSKFSTTMSEGSNDLTILCFLGQNADDKDNVIVVPSEIDGKKVVQLGVNENSNYSQCLIGYGGDTDYVDKLEAVVIPDSVEEIVYLWIITPKNMKYIVLPTKFENTGLEDRYDSNHQLTWIYKDVEN